MAIVVKNAAEGWELKHTERFVRAVQVGVSYFWCERDCADKRHDVRQGTCDAEDLPDDVRLAADVMQGRAFSYVEWPL